MFKKGLSCDLYSIALGGEVFSINETKTDDITLPNNRKGKDNRNFPSPPPGSITMMSRLKDAEAVKAMENTVRDVNIALVNELAKISDAIGLDVIDIINGMSTKPFGKGPYFPGVGVGGHCIAVDPEWLKSASERAGYLPGFIQLSRDTNNGMPEYIFSKLSKLLNERKLPLNGTVVSVFGVAYKKNIADTRESPFFSLKKLLLESGAEIKVFDSEISVENNCLSIEECLAASKAVVIVTDHSSIVRHLNSIDLKSLGIEVIVDGRNCLDVERYVDADMAVYRIGRN